MIVAVVVAAVEFEAGDFDDVVRPEIIDFWHVRIIGMLNGEIGRGPVRRKNQTCWFR